jgi:dTDP-4-amino-4,6-dideoxygalactose transaminase
MTERSGVADALERRIESIFERGIYANNGPLVQECDRIVAERAGRAFGAVMCSDMMAMMLVARAVFAEGTILVPSTLDPRMFEALRWGGFEPETVAVDEQGRLQPAAMRAKRTERTTGVVGALPYGRGNPAEMAQLADELALPLIFDASDAFGAACDGRPIPSFGIAAVVSFRDGQVVAAAGSGAVVTDDEELWKRMRTMRNFHPSQTFLQAPLRMNAKMAEGAAALLLSHLDVLDDLRSDRLRAQRELVQAIRSICEAEVLPAEGVDGGSFVLVRVTDAVAAVTELQRAGFDAARVAADSHAVAVRVVS